MTHQSNEIEGYIAHLGQRAKAAAAQLALANTDVKNAALRFAAQALRNHTNEIILANEKDVDNATRAGRPAAFIDRLMLDQPRVEGMASALEQIAGLPDPVGRRLASYERPNGLTIHRVSVPLGVIGMIYESRPNVGADAGALCLKSGNAVILRGGSDSQQSSTLIVACIAEGLEKAGLPTDAVQMIETGDRSAVKHLLQCVDYIDLVIPRGGRGLVELVRDQAKVPTLLHLDGNCHTYVHGGADIAKAVDIVRNAKLRRTGICGATESLVVDKSVAPVFLPALLDAMPDCEVRGDAAAIFCDRRIKQAQNSDWATEYLDTILSVKVVNGLEDAIVHVSQYSSGHTDAIITEVDEVAEVFMRAIDSAVVMHNASTQFSDGGEFGMGAEIGIATGKMHARGPVGLEQLTSFKYMVRGDGQVRA